MIAALFVETDGCYFGLDGVDPWDKPRDARKYREFNSVVCHPPCQRWGRYWGGSPRKPHQYEMGDDNGDFGFALDTLRRCGGVLEHPAGSHAWGEEWFNIAKPKLGEGWIPDGHGGFTCCVEQGHYGHMSRKATWLIAYHAKLPELIWTPAPQRLHPTALAKHGYEKARRIGMSAMVGGKDKTKIRERTPIEFRDVLISIARSAQS